MATQDLIAGEDLERRQPVAIDEQTGLVWRAYSPQAKPGMLCGMATHAANAGGTIRVLLSDPSMTLGDEVYKDDV